VVYIKGIKMGRRMKSGNSISMNHEVNMKGDGVLARSTKCREWPDLTTPTPDHAAGFSVMVPILMGILPVSAGLISVIVKHSQKYFKDQQEYLGHVNGQVEEVYGGHNIVKAFNKNRMIKKIMLHTNGLIFWNISQYVMIFAAVNISTLVTSAQITQ